MATAKPSQDPPASLATPEQLAAYLQVPKATLETWRYRKIGPAFIRVGGAVRYDWADVHAWEDGQKVNPAAQGAA